ncbi:MAG: FGGY-family carbohydrate kinase [Promethearchaeota archaeon]|jgi:sugar (pentulose or hexulose) kinase
MTDKICVFDVGTTGARTVIINLQGKEIVKAYEEYPPVEQTVGISEQDPLTWWNAVKNTCNKVVKSGVVNPKEIIGIVGTFQRATVTLIDDKGEVLHPALTWMDEREISDFRELQEERGLRRIIPKILWFKNNKTELYHKASKIVCTDSYIYTKLCGECVTDPTNAINGILNMETLQWDENLADLYDIPLNLWPRIVHPGEIIGGLTSEAAQALGLIENMPIIVGGGDQQCAALGLGVINNGQAKVTTGTGIFVDVVHDKPIQPVGDIPIFSFPHVVEGKWVIEGVMPGTGSALKWFKDNFSQLQIKESEAAKSDVYDVLSKEAEHISPGSNGLLFIPLYTFRKGTIHGLSFNHKRAHVIRAIMESAVLSAQMYLNIIEGMVKVKNTEIKVDGGGINSDLWAQIFADVIDKKIWIPENKDGAVLGAAILGFYGLRIFNTLEEAIEKMVRFVDVREPIKENTKIYKKLIRIFMPTVLEVNNNKRVTKNL